MNIHEYQAKKIFKDYGINVLDGYLVESLQDIEKAYSKIKTPLAVLKAQVHAGGRGKAGGVKLVKNLDEAKDVFTDLHLKHLVTHQTDDKGELIQKLYLESGCEIEKEFYLSFILNRKKNLVSIIASREGGMDIEKVAKESPEKVLTIDIDPMLGISSYMSRQIASIFELNTKEGISEVDKLIRKLFQIYQEKDASMIEINPLVLDKSGKLICLDAKLSFDDNALFRHSDIAELKDESNRNIAEIEAEKYGLSYVALDGNIGCLVNGAGLAMATMDSIKFSGGEPANFLDIGGGANDEIIARALSMIFSDKKVTGVLVNVFGGINHCDTIARGVVMAMDKLEKKIPIVVRLQGMNYELGKKIIEDSNHPIYLTDSMDEGSDRIVSLAKQA